MKEIVRDLSQKPINWLLFAFPVALVLEWSSVGGIWVFLLSCLAIIPLAGLMGRATESLAETMGSAVGGLLNATFGNAAELIIALVALWKGPAMYDLVKASITGSIIGNILLVMGLAITFGGVRHLRQQFNATAASMGATLLALAAIGLLIPTLYYYAFATDLLAEQVLGTSKIQPGAQRATVELLSEEIAAILALAYGLSLLFTLHTHRHLFADSHVEVHAGGTPEWDRRTSMIVLTVATIGVAVMSEALVGSVEHAQEAMGFSSVFVGVIVVAVIGNAAEHSTAILMALKNKMDLAVNIAVGSSIQIALFVAPVLVFASVLMGHARPLDLHFTPMETIAVVISVAILAMVSQDGESHWMEGVLLLAVYVILGLAFYHLPVPTHLVAGHGG